MFNGKKITPIIILVLTLLMALMPIQNTLAQTTITRDEVEQRALKMTTLTWTYSKDKNSNIASQYLNNVALPKQFNNITYATMTGIPYNWGGVDGIDSSSYNTPWINFLDAVNKGAHTGNINTSSGLGYIPGTAGLDCSGFVHSAFNIDDQKISTTTIFDKYFAKIDINNIKHMDILNKPGYHTVIFDKWGYNNGVYGAFTYESTVDQIRGGIQGAKKYFRSMNEINNGYIAGRYINIVESQNTQIDTTSTIKAGIFAQIVNVNEFANFRDYHSTSASIIGSIPKGTIIYLQSSSNGWFEINYNNKSGWVWSNLVGLLPSGKYVTIRDVYQLNIRQNASATSPIVGVLGKADYVGVIEYSNDGKWYKINKGGTIGWAASRYLNYIY